MQENLKKICILTLFITVLLSLTGCSSKKGNLLFNANGEEFVINGLVSKEGWKIDFDNVLVNISSPEAYNSENQNLRAILEGDHLIDLKRGSSSRPEVSVGIVPHAESGNYQSLKFSLKQIESGEYAGYSIVLKGIAQKDDEKLPFVIKLDEELTFNGREGYVGESIKGILSDGKTSDVEMTFHFDHLFGNGEMSPEDHVNSGSPGFALFLDYTKDRSIDVNQKEMRDNPLYGRLIQGIETLGHLGEGHCEVSR